MGISIVRSKSTKQLVWVGGCFVIEDIVIGQATRIATEGVYLFSDLHHNGQPYTGQAKNVKNRTNQHAKAGRVKADAFLRSFPVTVRDKGKIKDALDILEQWVLKVLLEEAGYDKSGKIKNTPVGNQKNVIGENRSKLQKALSRAKLCG